MSGVAEDCLLGLPGMGEGGPLPRLLHLTGCQHLTKVSIVLLPEGAGVLCVQWKNNPWSWLTMEVSVNIWSGQEAGRQGADSGSWWAGQALGEGGWQWLPQS